MHEINKDFRLKTCEINCKIRETRKIFVILHSAPYDNWYLLFSQFDFSKMTKFTYPKLVKVTVIIFLTFALTQKSHHKVNENLHLFKQADYRLTLKTAEQRYQRLFNVLIC